MKKALLLGYGYTARAFAQRLKPAGWRIAASFRRAEQAIRIERDGAEPVSWTAAGLSPEATANADAILISTPPDNDGCPALRAIADQTAASARTIKWIGYLSTNGVYGDHGGAWVDEFSALNATSLRARRRIRAEADWAAHAASFALPLVIFRLPGIYGPGRSTFDALREGRAQRIVKEGQVFSRAHVADIAAAMHASLDKPGAGNLFNIADNEPSPPQDVVEFAANLLGVPVPPLVPFETADLSEMARSFYADNKRVSNARMKERLLAQLSFPTYREGLIAILEEEKRARLSV